VRLCFIVLTALASPALADAPPNTDDAPPPAELADHGLALEANVLWPFYPGGIFELRLLVPVVRADHAAWRGELVLGAYSDFASLVIRGSQDGKVFQYAGKLGYRQYFSHGLQAELSANFGLRHEEDRPPADGMTYPQTIDGFLIRLWGLVGYQHDFTRVLYGNVRGGLSVNIYRSDAYAYLEKRFVPGVDINLGVRF
jgi:hypothetical protein